MGPFLIRDTAMADFSVHRHGRSNRQRSLRLWLAVFVLACFIGRCSIGFSNWSVASQKAVVDVEKDQGAVARRMLLPGIVSTAVLAATPGAARADLEKVNIADVIKVYNRLAGLNCFGAKVKDGEGFCCQIQLEDWDRVVFPNFAGSVTFEDFNARLNSAPSRWPLLPEKPDPKFTVDSEKIAERDTLRETAKRLGLEGKGFTLRKPKKMIMAVNEKLSQEPVDPEVAKYFFTKLMQFSKSEGAELSKESLVQFLLKRKAETGRSALDVESFQTLFDIIYPKEE